MNRCFSVLATLLLFVPAASARQELAVCGTHADNWREELQLHRKAGRLRGGRALRRQAAEPPVRAAGRDIGEIAVIEDADGVVSRRNPFDLDNRTVTFLPAEAGATRYRFTTGEASFDADAAARGALVAGFEDDDTRQLVMPFPFPFFGAIYRSVFLNSDGNLTFTAPDTATSARSLGRLTAGPPRIAPLFSDLDPSRAAGGVRVLAEAGRLVVSWVDVPEWTDAGPGPRQTFQVRLYPDGRIEFAYRGITTQMAVVGIAPGSLTGSTSVISFAEGSASEFSGAVVERFTNVEEVDIVLAAQKFYETHEDAYDYLVLFNDLGIAAGSGAVAFEVTVRNNRSGYGDPKFDIGKEFGSRRRLQAVMNMGPLSQYPRNPNEVLASRRPAGDTPLTVLGHEAGHLFLAFASIRDPADPRARPMLGRQNAHWNFSFNSEASLLEGNRICDREVQSCPGPPTTNRFVTVATVEGFAPLDQYLMGLRPPWEVPDTFLVLNSTIANPSRMPQVGISFNGTRRNISIDEIIAAEGRRTPDHTVSQRRFRFAFLLVVRQGSQPDAAAIEQVDQYRREFEAFYRKATGDRAVADTTLRRALHLSAFPAAGVLLGGAATATVRLESAAQADLAVLLASRDGAIEAPPSIRIPAGATSATFTIRGLRAGVDELTATVPGGTHEDAVARIQVLESPAGLRLTVVSGDRQIASAGAPLAEPVVVRLHDANELPYPGVRLAVSVQGGGRVEPAEPVTDEAGEARLIWVPGPEASNSLRISVAGGPAAPAATAVAVGRPSFTTAGVVNAASFAGLLAPGSLATIFGANLAGGASATATLPLPTRLGGVEVLVGGRRAPLHFVSDSQINFVVPLEAAPGPAEIVVNTRAGSSGPVPVHLVDVAPGVFVMPDGTGAAAVAGTGRPTSQRPAAAGEILEIYATGLGRVRLNPATGLAETVQPAAAAIGGAPATVVFSGLAPGWTGLYQINVQVPAGLPAGPQPLRLAAGGVPANEVLVVLR
jgi:uncharacterized protein (TIGR03437 family)